MTPPATAAPALIANSNAATCPSTHLSPLGSLPTRVANPCSGLNGAGVLLTGRSSGSRQRHRNAEAGVWISDVCPVPVSACRPKRSYMDMPIATAHGMTPTIAADPGAPVPGRPDVALVPAIRHPLRQVAVHLVKTNPIRWKRAHGQRAIFRVPEVHPSGVWLVSVGICSIGPGACSVFPLSFGEQAIMPAGRTAQPR